MPEARIARYEAHSVHLKQPHEGTAAGLVAVRLLSFAPVYLRKNRERQRWEGQPRRPDLAFVPDGERESADGQQVRRWAESQIDIDATGDRGTVHSVQTPSPL